MADDRVVRTYHQMLGSSSAADLPEAESATGSIRRPVEGDCAICFEELRQDKEALVWCATCGNNLHEKCFKVWASTKKTSHCEVTCVYCRSHWVDGSKPAAAQHHADVDDMSGGYVNLAQYSTAHRGADTSLSALYGNSAVWIEGGGGSRRSRYRVYRSQW